MVNWVIEEGIFPENVGKLTEEIHKQGYDFSWIHKEDFIDRFSYLKNPVIFYGSLALSQRLRKRHDWVGNWSDLSKFKCSSYYSKYKESLLNSEYCFIPAGDFDRFMKVLNQDAFIRPDSAYKTFTGDVIKSDQTLKNFLVNSVIFDDEMILVSSPKIIHREWRFIVCDGQIASYSLYMRNGNAETSPNCPQDIRDFVQKSLEYQPETCYILDVCENEDREPKIVEINSFSCSGFYEADLSKIVEAASKAAIKEWEELYE